MPKKELSSKIDEEIDRNLKRAFDSIASEALPPRFTDLLDQLRAQDAKAANRDDSNDN